MQDELGFQFRYPGTGRQETDQPQSTQGTEQLLSLGVVYEGDTVFALNFYKKPLSEEKIQKLTALSRFNRFKTLQIHVKYIRFPRGLPFGNPESSNVI